MEAAENYVFSDEIQEQIAMDMQVPQFDGFSILDIENVQQIVRDSRKIGLGNRDESI